MWLAILITVVASTGNNIGKALQKEAVHTLPRFSLYPATLQQYFGNSLWLSGLALDLVGALLMVAAFALAPVSLLTVLLKHLPSLLMQGTLTAPLTGCSCRCEASTNCAAERRTPLRLSNMGLSMTPSASSTGHCLN